MSTWEDQIKKIVHLQYFNGKKWVYTGGPFNNEEMAWISLGADNLNYRTVDEATGEVLTDNSKQSTLTGGNGRR